MNSSNQSYVLITGASSGIGRETAIRLSTAYNLILSGRDIDKLQATKLACTHPENQLIWPCDLSEINQLENSLIEFIQATEISISHFIHAAGITQASPFALTSVDLINKIYTTNTFSAILLLKTLSAKKINDKHLKSAVMISSNVSNFGAFVFSVYASSKSALDSFVRSSAMELAPAIRVNSVLPGLVRTPMTESLFADEAFLNKLQQAYPLGLPTMGDIVDAISFLLSDKAKMITGQQLVVDGGRTTLFKN